MKKILLLLIFLTCCNILYATIGIDSTTNIKRPKIGLVLSGGGAKGFAHVGVLKVIDKLGIPIDYIAGTSMGSIIGGFYAMGYTANEIEEIISEQNWDELLSDKVDRKYIPIYEKKAKERYALSFAIKPKGIQLPSGIVYGQKVLNLFEKLSIKYHNTTNFKKLPIPFVCVATNIENGKAEVLDKGYIPLALRASMAIPTIFTPVTINGKMLVDGGVVNNFPVDEVLKMGADIVIGVDVQSGVKSKKQINSVVDIMNQLSSLMGLKTYQQNKSKVNIYIKPDIGKYTVGSFNDADSLIKRGLTAGKKAIPQLLQLKRKYNLKPNKKATYIIPTDSTSCFIKSIEYNGLNKVSKSLINGKINLSIPGKVSLKDLEKGINLAYASGYFNTISFKMKKPNPQFNHKTLELFVKERTTKRFNVGFHYDTDNDASVLLNLTARNMLLEGSRFAFDLRLAQKPRFVVTYNVDNGIKPGFTLKAEYNRSEVFKYKKNKKTDIFDFNYGKLNLDIHSILKESYSIGIGAKLEYFDTNSQIRNSANNVKDDFYLSYYGYINLDTRNNAFYPQKGMNLYGEYSLLTTNGIKFDDQDTPSNIILLRYQGTINISPKVTFQPRVYGRTIWGKNLPAYFYSFCGGMDQTDYFDIQVPFVGLNRMELPAKAILVFRGDFQWEIFRNNYLILKPNLGVLSNDLPGLVDDGKWIKGIGLTFSYNSIIGPMELSLMLSDENTSLQHFVSLGFWF